MLHLADGTLRRLADEPNAATADQINHLAGCTACRDRRSALAFTAASVGSTLQDDAQPAVDVARAQGVVAERFTRAGSMERHRQMAIPRSAVRTAALAAAAVLLLFAFAATPLRTAALSFLAIFEPQQFVAVPLTRADFAQLRALPDLSAFGTLRSTNGRHVSVPNVEAAARMTGMAVAVPASAPSSLTAPSYTVASATSAAFTFSAAKARAAAAASGKAVRAMPARLDGSTLAVTIGPFVLATYHETSSRQVRVRARRHRGAELPALFVVQAPAPRVGSTGASVVEIERYLLAQPGVPPRLAAEIRGIGDPTTTLPIPIPIEEAYARPVVVQGVSGLAVGDNTGLGAGVLWQRDGMIHAVAGTLPLSQIVTIVNSVRSVGSGGIGAPGALRSGVRSIRATHG